MNHSNAAADAITRIYASALSPTGWQSLAPALADVIGAHSCQIGISRPEPGASQRISWTDNYTAELNQAYLAHYRRQDPWVAWLRRVPQEQLVTGDVATISPDFMQSEIYNDYCRPLGIHHVIGAGIESWPDGAFSLIGVHRERQHGEFNDRERRLLTSLLPHLRQAMALREQFGYLNRQRHALVSALEALHLGVLIVDGNGCLLFADSTAEHVLRGQSRLAVRGGRVHLADADQLQMLRKFIREAAAGAGAAGGSLRVRTDRARTLWVRVCPLPESVFGESTSVPGAIVFLRTTRSQHLPLQNCLFRLYGLTRAEARLAEAIVNGSSLAEYGAAAHVSLNTAKTLLKRIYAKTGHRSRSQFIRDVLSNPFLAMEEAASFRH